MRVLTLRELNRATLARQLLLERKHKDSRRDVDDEAARLEAWLRAPYVGLWARTEGFRREALEKALLARRIVRAVLMRGTIHLVSVADYALFGAAVDRPPWLKAEFAALGDRLHDVIRAFGREPRTRAEITEFLEREHGLDIRSSDPVWYALRTNARLTHAPESGLWRMRGTTRYVTIDVTHPDAQRARAELVRRYLAAFGPATRADVAVWSGLRAPEVASALDALEPLRRFRDEHERELLDLPRAPLPSACSLAPAVRQCPPVAQGPPARHRRRASRARHRRRLGEVDAPRRRLRRRHVGGRGRPRARRAVRAAAARRPARRRRRGCTPRGLVALMEIGAHVSSSGGIHNAVDRAVAIGADSLQLFTQSPRMWRPTNHDPATFERFRERRAETGMGGVLCHALYLCNLAAPNDEVYEKSVTAMRNTMEVACAIGADGVVFHVGSHLGSGFEHGLERAVPALEQVLELCSDETWLLMENSAGTGGTIGRSIEELAALYDRLDGHPRLGLCLDSCHLYASGVDVTDPAALDACLDEVDATIGLDRLRALHVNDAATALGSNRDRHANIGEGLLGEQLGIFLGNPRLQHLPAVIETAGPDNHGPDANEVRKAKEIRSRAIAG